ncbi:hypothetical protein DL93DRAFT_2181668 [Clavulina sp. PMI_390]|nr:hypothetical protein DL93DRAFT_2181668 [Clavulina sp. PMI_390]
MSQAIMKKTGMTIFAKHMKNYEPVDPLYETYVDKKGRTKKRRRELPPGLSERDAKILRKVKWRAHHLDKGFSLCGFRFGWTAIIGLIPIIGDFADIGVNYLLVVKKAREADLPPWLISKMLTNNAISAGIGLVPLAGDVMLAAFKANSRNAALLEEYLRIRGDELIKARAAREGRGPAPPEQDLDMAKPGAGRKPGEVISTGTGSSRSWFSGRKGKGKSTSQDL